MKTLNNIEYILFDLDGTLTDPGIGITNSVWYALKKFGIEVENRESLYKFIGPPLKISFAQFCGFSEEQCKLGIQYYREYFAETGIFENEVYDGMEEVLRKLQEKGKMLIVATSKPKEFAVRILEHFHLLPYFHYVAGATMDDKLCEKHDIIKLALTECNITDLSKAVMIGDRKFDILGAKTFDLASIGVTFGYGSEEELLEAGADFIARKPFDILNILI